MSVEKPTRDHLVETATSQVTARFDIIQRIRQRVLPKLQQLRTHLLHINVLVRHCDLLQARYLVQAGRKEVKKGGNNNTINEKLLGWQCARHWLKVLFSLTVRSLNFWPDRGICGKPTNLAANASTRCIFPSKSVRLSIT